MSERLAFNYEQSHAYRTFIDEMPFGRIPSLGDLTLIAHDCILRDVSHIAARVGNRERLNCSYVIVSGVLIHGPDHQHYFWLNSARETEVDNGSVGQTFDITRELSAEVSHQQSPAALQQGPTDSSVLNQQAPPDADYGVLVENPEKGSDRYPLPLKFNQALSQNMPDDAKFLGGLWVSGDELQFCHEGGVTNYVRSQVLEILAALQIPIDQFPQLAHLSSMCEESAGEDTEFENGQGIDTAGSNQDDLEDNEPSLVGDSRLRTECQQDPEHPPIQSASTSAQVSQGVRAKQAWVHGDSSVDVGAANEESQRHESSTANKLLETEGDPSQNSAPGSTPQTRGSQASTQANQDRNSNGPRSLARPSGAHPQRRMHYGDHPHQGPGGYRTGPSGQWDDRSLSQRTADGYALRRGQGQRGIIERVASTATQGKSDLRMYTDTGAVDSIYFRNVRLAFSRTSCFFLFGAHASTSILDLFCNSWPYMHDFDISGK